MRNFVVLLLLIIYSGNSFAIDKIKIDKSKTLNSKTNTNVVLTHNVFFNTAKHTITSTEFKKLLNFIEETKHVDIDRISVLGFCDDRGSIAYNQKLSNKRANAIKDIIIAHRNSMDAPRILNVTGKGEIGLSTSEQLFLRTQRALNRKVTILISPRKLIAGSFYSNDLSTGKLINLKTLKFKKGLRHLTPESIKYLKELTAFLVKRKDIYFTINGHVCCTENGAESRDKQTGEVNLSLVRAKYIRNYLVKKGVDAKRVKYRGLKGKYNLGGDPTEDRRVELLIRYVK